jgi:hypothetical protein
VASIIKTCGAGQDYDPANYGGNALATLNAAAAFFNNKNFVADGDVGYIVVYRTGPGANGSWPLGTNGTWAGPTGVTVSATNNLNILAGEAMSFTDSDALRPNTALGVQINTSNEFGFLHALPLHTTFGDLQLVNLTGGGIGDSDIARGAYRYDRCIVWGSDVDSSGLAMPHRNGAAYYHSLIRTARFGTQDGGTITMGNVTLVLNTATRKGLGEFIAYAASNCIVMNLAASQTELTWNLGNTYFGASNASNDGSGPADGLTPNLAPADVFESAIGTQDFRLKSSALAVKNKGANPAVWGTLDLRGRSLGDVPDLGAWQSSSYLLAINPSSIYPKIGAVKPFTVRRRIAAPAGGLTYNVSVADAGIATASATVSIAAGDVVGIGTIQGVAFGATTVTLTGTGAAAGESVVARAVVNDPLNLWAIPLHQPERQHDWVLRTDVSRTSQELPNALWFGEPAAPSSPTLSLALTDGADTLSAQVLVALAATLSATDAADTLTSAVSTASGLSASLTDTPDTLSAQAALGIALALAQTDAADSVSAIAALAIAASLLATDGADTVAALATLSVATALVATDGADTLSATLTGQAGISASLTDGADTLSAQVLVALAATLSATDAADTLGSALSLVASLALGASDAADTLSSSAGVRVTVAAALTDGPDTLSAAVLARVALAATLIDGADTIVASLSGSAGLSAALTDGPDTLSASAALQVALAGAPTDAPDTLAATVGVAVRATLVAIDAPDTLAAALGMQVRLSAALTDSADTLAAALTLVSGLQAALTDQPDTALAELRAQISVALAATDGQDTLLAQLSRRRRASVKVVIA